MHAYGILKENILTIVQIIKLSIFSALFLYNIPQCFQFAQFAHGRMIYQSEVKSEETHEW